jgi:hypothetical protein
MIFARTWCYRSYVFRSRRGLQHPQSHDAQKMVNPGHRSKGCATCRLRRIKCDEARPHCRKCAAANRTCIGYREAVSETPGLTSNMRKFILALRFGCCALRERAYKPTSTPVLEPGLCTKLTQNQALVKLTPTITLLPYLARPPMNPMT